ncbi:MAG: hypothetical protein WA771_04935 [Chthoniobacterales bacterium]
MNAFADLLSLAPWLAGIGHFCGLIASVQVPSRLRWREELAGLSALNRKLMWTYGAFTLLTIVAFGTLTLLLHDEFLKRDRAAAALAAFIAVFWTARILVDAFYFEHADWPVGWQFRVGHAMLTTLFVALAGTYWAVVGWCLI